MARTEHARWMAERWLAGWTPGAKDVEHKRTPFLVPWDRVPLDVQEYDRRAVSLIPALARQTNQKVCRAPAHS